MLQLRAATFVQAAIHCNILLGFVWEGQNNGFDRVRNASSAWPYEPNFVTNAVGSRLAREAR